MKRIAPICFGLFLLGAASLRAGSVISLTDGSETNGPLTLTPSTVSVQTNSSPTEINHADILEASFGEAPFAVSIYSSASSSQPPPAMKTQDIGAVGTPGAMSFANGTFTLTGSGMSPELRAHENFDAFFFAAMPWIGDGEWTSRLTTIDSKIPDASAGLAIRETLDIDAATLFIGATHQGNGGFGFRKEAKDHTQWAQIPMDLPIWFRLTRYGAEVFAATSSDGKEWDLIGEGTLKDWASTWVGFIADSRRNKAAANMTFDQVSFTPAPSEAQVYPPGVLLQSGTFLAGTFDHIDLDPNSQATDGEFHRNGKNLAIPRAQIAAITMLPTTRKQIADMSAQVGLLMKNGDVMEGDPQSINGPDIRVSSMLLGPMNYHRTEVRACILRPLQVQPAAYEFRLRDGSIINASDCNASSGNVAIYDMAGVSVTVDPAEIAQMRAGTAQVQNLAELGWKATPPPAPANAAPANAAPAANVPAPAAAPAAAPIPAVTDVPDPATTIQGWKGPNQEELIQAPLSMPVEFTLPGKFRAIGVRVALTPDSPANSSVVIRMLVDGREAARTPPFKAGDPPRYMQISVQDPRTVAFEADSLFAGAKALLIDPIAIRDK